MSACEGDRIEKKRVILRSGIKKTKKKKKVGKKVEKGWDDDSSSVSFPNVVVT